MKGPARKLWQLDAMAAGIIAGLTIIAYFVQIAPTISRNERVTAQAIQLAVGRAKSVDLERALMRLKDRLEQAQRATAAIPLTLEPSTALNQRLARLTDLAAQSSLQVDGIESGTITNLARYSTIAIRINGRGTYRNCAGAIRQLRTTMPDVGIMSFQMNSGGTGTATSANFVFELLWYTQPQGSPAARN